MTVDEDKVKKISALLERGGTMLAKHHDCGAPLFKYGGNVVCPVCDDPLAGDAEPQSASARTVSKKKTPRVTGSAASAGGADISELRASLLKYACDTAKQLTNGKDPDTDALLLANIEAALRCAAFLGG